MKRSLILLVLGAAAAVAVVVSGCGASNVTAGDALAKAAATTTSGGGARVAMTITLSSNALPRTIHITANGVVNQTSRQGRINLDMSDLANAAGGSGLDPSQLKGTEILNGNVVYMRLPVFDGKLPDDKKWIKVDIAKTGKALGINLGAMSPTGQDPNQQIGYLRTVSDAKKVGTDTISGVKTTHYHGVARLDRYPDVLPPSQRASARAGIQRLIKVTGTNSLPIDAWVDGGNRIRRVKVTLNTKVAQSSQTLRMDIQEDLFDFGAKADTTPPPADQVFDITGATTRAIKSSGLGG